MLFVVVNVIVQTSLFFHVSSFIELSRCTKYVCIVWSIAKFKSHCWRGNTCLMKWISGCVANVIVQTPSFSILNQVETRTYLKVSSIVSTKHVCICIVNPKFSVAKLWIQNESQIWNLKFKMFRCNYFEEKTKQFNQFQYNFKS